VLRRRLVLVEEGVQQGDLGGRPTGEEVVGGLLVQPKVRWFLRRRTKRGRGGAPDKLLAWLRADGGCL
jgi:hypothetical protein